MRWLQVWCLGEGETVQKDTVVITKVSAGKDLDLVRREREKKKKSPLFKIKYPKARLLVKRWVGTHYLVSQKFLQNRSIACWIIFSISLTECQVLAEKGTQVSTSWSQGTHSLAFSWALFQLISSHSQEAIPYINRQLGLVIYFAGCAIAS